MSDEKMIYAKCCGTCKFFKVHYWENIDGDDLPWGGECVWDVELPWAYRWVGREVAAVYSNEGGACPQWKRK